MSSFSDLCLAKELVLAVGSSGLHTPTPIQASAIPAILEGKDVVAQAPTGSGKTLAFLLPICSSLLSRPASLRQSGIRAVILVPTQELCEQTETVLANLIGGLKTELSLVSFSKDQPKTVYRNQLQARPSFVIGTPSRVLSVLTGKDAQLFSEVEFLVVDEADLLLSFGYQEDFHKLCQRIPKTAQKVLLSATMSADLNTLQNLLLQNPVRIVVEEKQDAVEEARLSQFYLSVDSVEDKYLYLFALIKFRAFAGRCLLFGNSLDQCYRLSLFLEKFGLRAQVLNSDLPFESRLLLIEQFGQGHFNYLIVTDKSFEATQNQHEQAVAQQQQQQQLVLPSTAGDADHNGASAEPVAETALDAASKGKRLRTSRSFSSVARGFDFKNVETVINVDLPDTLSSYIHRIGRTARAGAHGNALSFFTKSRDSAMLESIKSALAEVGASLSVFDIVKEQVEGFRYRVEDVLRLIGKKAVKEAQMMDLRDEVLKSEQLKSRLEVKPEKLEALTSFGSSLATNQRSLAHLKSVPAYLAPHQVVASETAAIVQRHQEANKAARKRNRQLGAGNSRIGSASARGAKRSKRGDPLKA